MAKKYNVNVRIIGIKGTYVTNAPMSTHKVPMRPKST